MKKFFLLICILPLLFSLKVNAQSACTPSSFSYNIGDTTALLSIPQPVVGSPYYQQIDFIFPQDTLISGVGMEDVCSFQLDSIRYLPTGLTYICGGTILDPTNPQSWKINHTPGAVNTGCVVISGTPTFVPTIKDSIRLMFRMNAGAYIPQTNNCLVLQGSVIPFPSYHATNNPSWGLGNDVHICGNGSTNLCFWGANPNSTYSWSFNNNPLGVTTSCYNVSNSTGSGTYIVNATDPNNNTYADTIVVNYSPAITSINITSTANCLTASNQTTLSATPVGGTSPYTYTWVGGNISSGLSLTTSYTGNYYCTINDANNCSSTNNIFILDCSATCQFKGKLYSDVNLNGVYDMGDMTIPNHLVYTNGGYGPTTLTDNQGNYTLYLDSLVNYTVQTNPFNGQSFTPANYPAYFSNGYASSLNNDFVLPPFIELNTTINNTVAAPGFNMTYYLSYFNVGDTVTNASLSFTFPPNLSFLAASVLPNSQSGNTLTWDFPYLFTGTSDVISVEFNVPVNTPLGTILQAKDSISVFTGDTNPANNVAYSAETVVGSFDPNDKAVSKTILAPAEVPLANPLTYKVRFQNTGTAPAHFIVVRDTISNNLDLLTFKSLTTSHNCAITLEEPNVLVWFFDNIMLADSTHNEPESHGYFSYQLTPKTTLQLGDEIHNKAAIYFDFNAPVITNDAITRVEDHTKIEVAKFPNLKIYPNPAKNELHLEWENESLGNGTIRLMDIQGKTLKEEKITSDVLSKVFLLDNLQQGIYFIQISAEKQSLSAKFLKL